MSAPQQETVLPNAAPVRAHRGNLAVAVVYGAICHAAFAIGVGTMTVAMFQALEGTSPGAAAAAATVLILFTILPVALVYRLLRRYELSML